MRYLCSGKTSAKPSAAKGIGQRVYVWVKFRMFGEFLVSDNIHEQQGKGMVRERGKKDSINAPCSTISV